MRLESEQMVCTQLAVHVAVDLVARSFAAHRHLGRPSQVPAQPFAQGAPGARQPRHDSAERHSQRVGDLFVAHLFHIAEQDDLAKRHRQLFERALEGVVVGAGQQQGLGGLQRRGLGRGLLALLSIHVKRYGSPQSGARGQERVAQDFIDPGAKIRSRLEAAEATQGLHVSLLHQVLGLGAVLGQPVRQVVQAREERHRQLLE